MRTPTSRARSTWRRPDDDLPAVPLLTPLPMHCYIIAQARAFDSEMGAALLMMEDDDGPRDLDDALYATGRKEIAEDSPYDDLLAALRLLHEEQLHEVVALMWVGRGDYDRYSWRDALEAARDLSDERDMDVYLVGTPMLADLLEEGLTQLGHDCGDTDRLPL